MLARWFPHVRHLVWLVTTLNRQKRFTPALDSSDNSTMPDLAEPQVRAIVDAMDWISPPEGWAVTNDVSETALENYRTNHLALAITQPDLSLLLPNLLPETRWLFARDGFLTARTTDGHWLSGCSLPRRAADSVLRRLDVIGGVACFLAPSHAAQVQVALDRMATSQALIVVYNNWESLLFQLACCDSSIDIQRHRLWFAVGHEWPAMLANLFRTRDGLAIPTQFIRTPLTDESLTQALIPAAEKVFAAATTAQNHTAAQWREKWISRPSPENLLVVAPSGFRLWNHAPASLLQAAQRSPLSIHHLDLDDPASASIAALARAAAGCDALFVADLSRAQLPGVINDNLPITSWITRPHCPPYDAHHPQDCLLLADGDWLQCAQGAGWPKERLAVASWPTMQAVCEPEQPPHLAIIADTRSLETPVDQLEHSSHHILYEVIRTELLAEPFKLGTNPRAYLQAKMRTNGIFDKGFNYPIFDELLESVYMQGIVQRLKAADIPIRIHGKGWDGSNAVRSLPDLLRAAGRATALAHVWGMKHRHPIDALSRPVLRCDNDLIYKARRLLRASPKEISKSTDLHAFFSRWGAHQ